MVIWFETGFLRFKSGLTPNSVSYSDISLVLDFGLRQKFSILYILH